MSNEQAAPTRGQVRVEAILEAATDLVAQIGYDRVTVDAIAARAHASKATMYRNWPDKATLIAAAIRRQAQGAGELKIADTGSLRGDLLVQVGAIADAIAGEGACLLKFIEAVRDDADLRTPVRAQIEAASAHVGEVLARQCHDRGDTVDTSRVQAALGVAVGQLLTAALMTGTFPDADTQRRLVDDVLIPMTNTPPPANHITRRHTET